MPRSPSVLDLETLCRARYPNAWHWGHGYDESANMEAGALRDRDRKAMAAELRSEQVSAA